MWRNRDGQVGVTNGTVSCEHALRVLYISSVDPTSPTGPGGNEREFLLSLQQHPGLVGRGVVASLRQQDDDVQAVVRRQARPYESTGSLSFFAHQLSLVRAALAEVDDFRPHLLVFRASVLPWAQLWIARSSGLRYVVKTLGAGVFEGVDRAVAFRSRVLSRVNVALLRKLASGASYVDVCTPELAKYVSARLSMPVTSFDIVPNTTNVQRFRPLDVTRLRSALGLEARGPIIGLVGGRPWDQGGMQIIGLLPELVSEYPAVTAVIVGAGEGLASLKVEAHRTGVADRVVFTGRVPYDQVALYINLFDVCVSMDLAARITAIGNSSQKVRQYVACGKPVVVNGNGNAFLCDEALGSLVKNSDEFRGAIRQWIALDDVEKASHAEQAIGYANRVLCSDVALSHRLKAWMRAIPSIP